MKQSDILSLLSNVCKDNVAVDMRSAFVGDNVFLAGHRRACDPIGDLLVKVTTKNSVERDVVSNGSPFVYFFTDQSYIESEGLYGEMNTADTRNILTPEAVDNLFQALFMEIKDDYRSVLLNPKSWVDFIEERTYRTGLKNQFLNIGFIQGMSSANHVFRAFIEPPQNNDPITYVVIRFKDEQSAMSFGASATKFIGEELYGMFPIDVHNSISIRKSVLEEHHHAVLVRFAQNEQNNVIAQVVSYYQPGVRVSIQHFREGMKMLNSPHYTLFENHHAKVTDKDIITFPFIKGQEMLTKDFMKAPNLHVYADTMYRAMKTLEMFPVVKMDCNISSTPAFITGENEDIKIEMVVGMTIPVVKGKVWIS